MDTSKHQQRIALSAMRKAQRQGVNPYNTQPTVAGMRFYPRHAAGRSEADANRQLAGQ